MFEIKAFFFDLGGVFLDHSECTDRFHQKVAQAVGLPLKVIEDVYQQGIGRYWFEWECGRILPLHFYRQYAEAVQSVLPANRIGQFHQKFSYGFFREAFGNVFTAKPRVIQLAAGLKSRGFKLVMVSNNNPIHYDYCLRTSPVIFDLPHHVVLSHEMGVRKPDRAIWLLALTTVVREDSSVGPENILVVDDKKENVDSARALGMNGAVFTTVERLKADLELFEIYFNKTF